MKRIDKYLKNELTEQELGNHTQDLLRAKFDRERQERWSQLLEEEHGIERSTTSASPGKRIWLWRLSAAAAAILLLWMVRPAIESRLQSPDIQLADQYLQTEKFPNSLTRKGVTKNSEWRIEAAAAYNAGEYAAAIHLNQQLVAGGKAKVEDYFFLGMSHVYQDQYGEAITAFQEALSSIDTSLYFQQETNWYLALTYLKAGQREQAQALLEQIHAKRAWHWEEAAALLERME